MVATLDVELRDVLAHTEQRTVESVLVVPTTLIMFKFRVMMGLKFVRIQRQAPMLVQEKEAKQIRNGKELKGTTKCSCKLE